MSYHKSYKQLAERNALLLRVRGCEQMNLAGDTTQKATAATVLGKINPDLKSYSVQPVLGRRQHAKMPSCRQKQSPRDRVCLRL